MFPLVYLPYAAVLVWALFRRRRGAFEAGRLREWRLTAAAMIALPVVMAGVALLVARQTENATALVASFYVSGGLMLTAGFVSDRLGASMWPLLMRLGGWGLVAGLTVVPSTLVLLLPFVSLLAFLVPEDYRRRAPAPKTA